MRMVGAGVVGMVAGLLAGILLSEFIGIVGFLAFDRLIGVKFLPLYLGAAGVVVAPLVYRRIHRT